MSRTLSRAARALAVAGLAAVAIPAHAGAQTNIFEPKVPLASAELALEAKADPTATKSDSTTQKAKRTASTVRSSHLFYGALLAGAALSFNYSIDPDEGGYEDKWNTLANFPDKGVHALAAFALTGVGVDLGARPWVAAASVCAAGAAFEFSQGYVSRVDIAADCVGAAGAALWRTWRARVNERNGR